MSSSSDNNVQVSCVLVEPGICGFPCKVTARKQAGRMVSVAISGSNCDKIKKLSLLLTELSLRDIFLPMTRNPVYISAEKSGCHPSCPIPSAVLKTAEVAMELALPMDVIVQFLKNDPVKNRCDAA
jgi:hypothetical protein